MRKLKADVTDAELAVLKTLGRAANGIAKVTREDLDPAERVVKRLEWQRRADRALTLAL